MKQLDTGFKIFSRDITTIPAWNSSPLEGTPGGISTEFKERTQVLSRE